MRRTIHRDAAAPQQSVGSGGTSSTFPVQKGVFNTGEIEMERFLHHSTRPDPIGSSQTLRQDTLRFARWLWPPLVADADARHDDVDATADGQPPSGTDPGMMHWVPLVVPGAAVFMLFLAVIIGSRLY
jgi:hypothetical protein